MKCETVGLIWYMDLGLGSSLDKTSESSVVASPRMTGITVDKSVEFSYGELDKATDGFSVANIIGQGGFGSVYYAELRNEVCHDVLNSLLKWGLILIRNVL